MTARMHHLSLAVIGPCHSHRNAPKRVSAAVRCRPGEPVMLVSQPQADDDRLVVQIITQQGQPIGRLTPERSAWLVRLMSGREVRAVYQEMAEYGAVIRVAFDGEQPAVPAPQQTISGDLHSPVGAARVRSGQPRGSSGALTEPVSVPGRSPSSLNDTAASDAMSTHFEGMRDRWRTHRRARHRQSPASARLAGSVSGASA
ncbi:HIRAN domain-containing protein [Sphingomonas natans]|uniref:HIRAN domain-containing protein n=1 Tax=Sphingomonas natans TaxID=3063330 RepID=UPI003D666D57